MKKQIIILFWFLLLFNICKSQNDTIYCEENYIVLNGIKYNQTIENKRTGKWIEFEIDNSLIHLVLGHGSGFSTSGRIYFEYRALKQNEYNGIQYPVSSVVDCDTIDNYIYCNESFFEIRNKIAPKIYKIVGKGNYLNDKKVGHWNYYHLNGVLKKEIYYKNGIPKKSFKIFRQDSSLIFDIKKLNDSEWEICKYSENGEKIDCSINNLNEFNVLY